MSKFLSKRLQSLEEYVPGEQPRDKKYIKLNTNESPYPPTPRAIEKIGKEELSDLRLYSDPTCRDLTDAVSNYYGVKPENIIFGNGSDDILAFAFSAFCDKETPAYFADITYGFYRVFGDLNCIDYTQIPLKDDFTIDLDKFKNVHGTIFIANPNAPTGITLSLDNIKEILDANRQNVVVIDEAYADFGDVSALSLINEYDNLLIVRTYSKSRNLAGARLGYGIGNKELISDLQRIRNSNNPYNINRITQIMGIEAILDDEYFKDCTNKIKKTRSYLNEELTKLGFICLPSSANFIFAKHNKVSGEEIYLKLKENGILVRHFNKDRISDFNRITIGTTDEANALINTLKKILKEEN